MRNKLLLAITMLLAVVSLKAQKIKIDAVLLRNDSITSDKFVVEIIDETNNIKHIVTTRKLNTELDYNHEYKIVFYSNGCQPKYIYFDTNTEDKKRVKYVFNITLRSTGKGEMVNAGGVYYNKNESQFDYYLTKQ